jgi:hypothetical protein
MEYAMREKSKEALMVFNPRGEREAVPARGVSPRVAKLEGKRIGLYWNGKPDGDYFWDTIEELLKKKFPTARVLRYNGPGDLGETLAAKMAKEVDTFLYGVGD